MSARQVKYTVRIISDEIDTVCMLLKEGLNARAPIYPTTNVIMGRERFDNTLGLRANDGDMVCLTIDASGYSYAAA